MFTAGNHMAETGINHIHMFVEDLEEAEYACKILDLIITIGYPNLKNA